MSNNPIDFTKSPLERLVEIANSPIEQNLLNTEQTTLLNFHVFGGSDSPEIANAEIIIEHNRIPEGGLPAGVMLPDEPIVTKTIEYFRKDYTAEDVFEVTLNSGATLTMDNMLTALKNQHGLDVSVNDLTGTFTPTQGNNVIGFGSESLLYGGALTINITITQGNGH